MANPSDRDLLLEQNNTLYPVEVKKTASPTLSAAKNFRALNPVSRGNAPEGVLGDLTIPLSFGC